MYITVHCVDNGKVLWKWFSCKHWWYSSRFFFFLHISHVLNYTTEQSLKWSPDRSRLHELERTSYKLKDVSKSTAKLFQRIPTRCSTLSNRDAISHQATRSQQKRPGAFIHPEKKSFADHFSIFLSLPWSQLLGIPIVGPDSSSTFLSPFLQSLLFCLLPQKIFALIEVRDACSEYP